MRRPLAPILLCGAGLVGASVVLQPGLAAAGAALLMSILAVEVRAARPYILGVLIILLVNGVPFLDMAAFNSAGSFNYQDPILAVLAMVTAYVVFRNRSALADTPSRLWWLLAVFLLAWSTAVLAAVAAGVPALKAVLFGRDLLAVLVVVSVLTLLQSRGDVIVFLRLLLLAGVVYALAHVLQVTTGLDTSVITHPKKVTDALGFARLYASMIPLTSLAFFAALAYAIWGASSRVRLAAAGCVMLLGLEQLLQLTRANYIALAAALVVGAVVSMRMRARSVEERHVAGVMLLVAVFIVATVVGWNLALQHSPIMGAVGERIASTAAEVAQGGGNYGYRVTVFREMLDTLGWRWPLGLGFIHPESKYMPTLPNGSIRNSDMGLLSVVMTMGVVGAIAMILAPLLMLSWGRQVMATSAMEGRIVGFLGVHIAILAIVSAPTLGYLATLPGLTVTACTLGVVCRVFVLETAVGGELKESERPEVWSARSGGVGAPSATVSLRSLAKEGGHDG